MRAKSSSCFYLFLLCVLSICCCSKSVWFDWFVGSLKAAKVVWVAHFLNQIQSPHFDSSIWANFDLLMLLLLLPNIKIEVKCVCVSWTKRSEDCCLFSLCISNDSTFARSTIIKLSLVWLVSMCVLCVRSLFLVLLYITHSQLAYSKQTHNVYGLKQLTQNQLIAIYVSLFTRQLCL